MEFKAEDFQKYLPSVETSNVLYAEMCADAANARLQEMLAQAPVVYWDDLDTMNPSGLFKGNIKRAAIGHTHQAKLVDIKPIEESK